MVITAITLENFKGIKGPCRIKLRPLTMLFGANSAGKSSVVQALHYAREIFMRQNTDPDKTLLGGSMDLGGFSNMVYKHDQSLPIYGLLSISTCLLIPSRTITMKTTPSSGSGSSTS